MTSPMNTITTVHALRQIAEASWQRNARAADLDLTPTQAMVLSAVVSFLGTPSQTDVVDVTGIDRSTVADVVRRLVARGMLTRRRTADRRRYALALTASGFKALAATDAVARLVAAEIIDRAPLAGRLRIIPAPVAEAAE